jgi:HAD superfamily hydrolase (TIGR01490 family)
MSERVSIFDMDRTITRGGSYSPWLLYWAWNEARWRLIFLPISVLAGLAYLVRLISRGQLKEINHWLIMGRHVDGERLSARVLAFGAKFVEKRCFPAARERLRAEAEEGRRVVLATASYDFYVEGIARKLGVSEIIATRARRSDTGGILARLEGENCYGEAKLAMVKAFFPGRRKFHIRFFSDHHSDVPTLEWADEAFAVNPSPRLRALAKARGWTVLNWR